jgi:hypothetical protein
MSLHKQAEGWGAAILITLILSGIFYLLVSGVELVLSIALKDNTSEQNREIAKAVVGIPLCIWLIILLWNS